MRINISVLLTIEWEKLSLMIYDEEDQNNGII